MLAIDCRMIGSGGIGTYISSLIPHFLDAVQCLLIGEREQIAAWAHHPNAVLCPCGVKMFSVREFLFFPRNIARRINECIAFYTPYCSIPSGIRVPIFATIHDVVFLDMKGLSSPLGTMARRLVYQYAVFRSRLLFTVSEFSARRIRAMLITRGRNIVVAYDALPDWLVTEGATPVVKKRQILFVGNIKRHKGLSTLLAAFDDALGKGLDADLVVVGASEGFRTGDSTISNGEHKRVHFTGRISDAELLDLYRTSALLVQPSLYEGFGLPPLEALNLGTRVLVSDILVFREIYDGFPVMYFRPGDKGDLAAKLLECMAGDWAAPPPTPPQKYSFTESARTILQEIKMAQ